MWLAPLALLALLLAWQTDWGRAFARTPPAEAGGGARSRYRSRCCPNTSRRRARTTSDVVERTLFNPTRRPAPPPAVAEVAKPKMQRGQFALSGTLVVDGKATAFLKEVAGRQVAPGAPGRDRQRHDRGASRAPTACASRWATRARI